MFAGQIRRASDGVRGLERAHRQGRARAHDEEFTVDRAQLHTPERPRSGPLRRVPPGGGRCVVAGRMSARRSAPERARRRGERWPGIVSGRVREHRPRRAGDEVRVTGPCVTTAGTQARGRRATWRPHGTCAAPRRERVSQTAAATVGGAPRKMNECLRNLGASSAPRRRRAATTARARVGGSAVAPERRGRRSVGAAALAGPRRARVHEAGFGRRLPAAGRSRRGPSSAGEICARPAGRCVCRGPGEVSPIRGFAASRGGVGLSGRPRRVRPGSRKAGPLAFERCSSENLATDAAAPGNPCTRRSPRRHFLRPRCGIKE